MRAYVQFTANSLQIAAVACWGPFASLIFNKTMNGTIPDLNIYWCSALMLTGILLFTFGWYILYIYHYRDSQAGKLKRQ